MLIVPAIAQRLVDNTKLPITSATLTNPTPDGITFSLVANLALPGGIGVDLKPMTLGLYTNTTGPTDPYLKVSLPEYHLKGKSVLSVTNDTAKILNQTQFEDFLSIAVNSVNFSMSAYGKTDAYIGAIKIPLTLDKKVEMPGNYQYLTEI